MKAIVLIAHGSRRESSNTEFITMVDNIQESKKESHILKAAFLELKEPSIKEASEELIQLGHKDICFYPFFLNSGKHVLVDIPKEIKELENTYKDINFTLLSHFGSSKKIEDLIIGMVT
jgi:sirohydrochlorin cobaltochelatase